MAKQLPACLSHRHRTRLWSKVNKTSTCWLWTGSLTGSGYPAVWINNIQYTATRIAYLDWYGEQPQDLEVCHRCDNPICMNPRHFFLGTKTQNQHDKVRKNRQAKGEVSGSSKLKIEQVLEIVELEGILTHRALSQKYGVSKSAITSILRGRNWKHLTQGHKV